MRTTVDPDLKQSTTTTIQKPSAPSLKDLGVEGGKAVPPDEIPKHPELPRKQKTTIPKGISG